MLSHLWCVIAILAVRAEASRCLPHHLLLHGSLLLLLATHCLLLASCGQRAYLCDLMLLSVQLLAPLSTVVIFKFLCFPVYRCHYYVQILDLSIAVIAVSSKFRQITTSWRRTAYREALERLTGGGTLLFVREHTSDERQGNSEGDRGVIPAPGIPHGF